MVFEKVRKASPARCLDDAIQHVGTVSYQHFEAPLFVETSSYRSIITWIWLPLCLHVYVRVSAPAHSRLEGDAPVAPGHGSAC
eukprot:2572292-Pleurochrysis_carterae.AAC.2